MGSEAQSGLGVFGQMRKRRVTLDDGRYLIFYTFDGDIAATHGGAAVSQGEPEAEPVAEEERRV